MYGTCETLCRELAAKYPGDTPRSFYPCIPASPAKMEARHSPHTTLNM